MKSDHDADGAVSRVGRSVLVTAIVIAVVAFFAANARFAISVVVGGAIVSLNLVALAKILRATLVPPHAPQPSALWALAFVAKLVGLFGGTYLLFASGWVTVLGVAVGFAALLPAVVLEGARASADDGRDAQ